MGSARERDAWGWGGCARVVGGRDGGASGEFSAEEGERRRRAANDACTDGTWSRFFCGE